MSGPVKKEDGFWHIDERPYGRDGPRIRKKFKVKSEALRHYKWILSEAASTKKWNPPKKDKRLLSDLVQDWYKYHGQNLKSGEQRRDYLLSLCELMGNPLAVNFTGKDFIEFRERRITQGVTGNILNKKGIKPSTCNHDLSYFKAVFNELIRIDNWHGENPLNKVRPLKYDEVELSFLDFDQINELLVALSNCDSRHALVITKICLSTGARWSEAQNLNAEQVKNCKITFNKTKSSKLRTIPISKSLQDEIFTGRRRNGPLFSYCYKSFERAIKKTSISLPANQLTHILRHTFASQFMMAGRSLLTLNKILGHADIKMTMRYAHLSPDHLEDAVKFNPLELSRSKRPQIDHINVMEHDKTAC